MNRPDYVHMENLIIGAITGICRNDNVNRQQEMTGMIDFLGKMHSTAVMTLSGAVLMSAKIERDKDDPDQERVDQMLTAVKTLVEAVDADFSMQLRTRILALVEAHDLPDPLTAKPSDSQ